MSRCILVLGTECSGVSVVSEVLHKLGCPIGGNFGDPDFSQVVQQIIDRKEGFQKLESLLKSRLGKTVWGLSGSDLLQTAQFIIPMLHQLGCEVRVVVCRRNRAEIINKYMRTHCRGRTLSEEWYEESITSLAARLLEYRGPKLEIWYEDLLEEPKAYTRALMHYVFEGLELPDPIQFRSASQHIKAKPKKKLSGWGDIAVGIRVAKSPEPHFFVDWTKLLTGGLRGKDVVLMPQMFAPAHWAANKVVKAFLETDKDTLLFIDDDMTFPMRALHDLRENKSNWGYDLVMGFCTRRGWPPQPIVYHLKEVPKMPQALRGDQFSMEMDFEDGDVVEVDAVGLGFTVIRRQVLEEMIDLEKGLEDTSFFKYEAGESEDIYFSRTARNLGFRMAVDTSVKIGHISHQPRGWEEFQVWRKYEKERLPDNVLATPKQLKPILDDAIKMGNKEAARLKEYLSDRD